MAGCNDDAGGGTHSELDLAVIAGQTLRVMVSSYAATGGDLDFLLDFLPDAGHVPDGGLFPGTPLDITDAGGGALRLVWSASCVTTDVDYEVYEGALGSFYSHGPIVCSTQGATAATIVPAPYDTYYLVVPANLRREGSYGLDSSGVERPAGARGCLPQAIGVCSASLTARQE